MEKLVFRFPAWLQRGAYAWLKRRSMIFLDGPRFVCFRQFTKVMNTGLSPVREDPFRWEMLLMEAAFQACLGKQVGL